MIGQNPLWVAKQHGHSVTTMFRVYTAWAEGALEADSHAIKRAMKRRPAPALDPELENLLNHFAVSNMASVTRNAATFSLTS